MASFRFDTELLNNMVAATPVSAHSTFSTLLHPTTRRPAVLGISNDQPPQLQLVAEDGQGLRRLYNFGEMLGIPNGTVQCFAAQQASDLRIYAVIAFKESDTMSRVVILKPFSLDSLDNLPVFEVRSISKVHKFFMGPVATNGTWPLVLAIRERIDRYGGGRDISSIIIRGDIWQETPRFNLPENSTDIIDACGASSAAFGGGVWCLYVIQGETRLIGNFALPDRHGRITYQVIRPRCPVGATALDSFVFSQGETALLIGASQGLSILTPEKSKYDHEESVLISRDDIFKSPARLSVAQDGDDMTVWSIGDTGNLGYSRTKSSIIKNLVDPRTTSSIIEAGKLKTTTLMRPGNSSNFSATISQPDSDAGVAVVTQSVISNDLYGNLSWLQQNTDTGIWKIEPFIVNDAMKLYEVKSYTITITAIDENQTPVVNGSVLVTSDSTVQAWANGVLKNISSEGTRLPLDDTGELNLIVPTSGIAGRVLKLDKLQNDTATPITATAISIDPTSKVMRAFASINSSTDLGSLRGRNGTLLYDSKDNKPHKDELIKAAKCFESLNMAMADVTSGISSIVSPRAVTQAKDLPDILMDGFNWIKEQLKDAYGWMVKKVGQAWLFVCEIGNQTKNFVLDCVEKVGEAAMWVWDKIKLGIDKLVEFAGWVFNWEDIKATRDTVAGLLDAGFAYGTSKLRSLEVTVEDFFNRLDQVISGQQTAIGTTDESWQHPTETTEAQNSSAYKWMTERFKNGGAATGMSFHDKNDDSNTDSVGSFAQIFAPINDSFGVMIKDITNNISDLFQSGESLTNKSLWGKLGHDFLKDSLKIVKNIVLAMLKLAEKLVNGLSILGKKPINIPVISSLWKKISGHDLTIFDAVSLILGFMICTFSKLITGEKPPSFPNMNAEFIDKLISNKHPVETKRQFAKLGALVSLNVTVILDLLSIGEFFIQMISKGTAHVVKGLTPGKAMLILKTLAGIVGLISAYPTDPEIPGYELRKWTVYLGGAAIGSTALFTLSGAGGLSGPKPMETFNCVISLVNFVLYNVIYANELDGDAQFAGKDTVISSLGIVENVFATVAVAARCTAVYAVDANPGIAAGGLVVMTAANRILTVNKGFTLSRSLELESVTTRGVAPPL